MQVNMQINKSQHICAENSVKLHFSEPNSDRSGGWEFKII